MMRNAGSGPFYLEVALRNTKHGGVGELNTQQQRVCTNIYKERERYVCISANELVIVIFVCLVTESASA